MIEYIDIQNFGSFQNFIWSASLRDKGNNVAKFKKLNILYGRNYSGKTTLSRILRSLETGILPPKYSSPNFSVVTTSGTITNTQIPASDIDIRVYNKDFVEDNLSFLTDTEGHIIPFAVLGSENKAIEDEIAEKENELGNIEEKIGLRFEYEKKKTELDSKRKSKEKSENELKAKLTTKATQPPGGIKHNTIYKDPNYNTPKIEADIKTIRSRSLQVLSSTDRSAKEALLNETSLPDINKKLSFDSNIPSLYETAKDVVSKKITPTRPIQELLNDAVLQAWVKEGIPHHKNKRENCGFCGQRLPDDLWSKLGEHFSKESDDLDELIRKTIEDIKQESENVKSIINVEEKDFYSTLQASFKEEKKALEKEIKQYANMLDSIKTSLDSRAADIFNIKEIPDLNDNSSKIKEIIDKLNDLIDQNDSKTDSLSEDQTKAREELRLSEVAQFIQDIDLAGEEKKISEQQNEVNTLNKDVIKIQSEIQGREKRIEELRIQLKDEKMGAEKVNEYLNHYFGHESLRLEAVEDTETSAYKFQIFRGDNPAYNLSEGECSLVAFCYFIARLEDAESQGKKLVVCIDDPVSSLDSNHIFFVFSLIESLIAKPEEDSEGNVLTDDDNKPIFKYEQLFISTHNLDFLKYLKKLSRPKRNHEHFLVVSKEGASSLELMPDYLRDYITEFNFLFGEIYTCVDSANATTHHHCFYNFGNNLRKFLESFLFFKFPFSISDRSDYDERIKKFFRDEPHTEPLVQRLTNEFSHLTGIFDRSVQPIDYPEIAKLAIFVLKKIKDNDSDQYDCFLQSINKPDPLSPQ